MGGVFDCSIRSLTITYFHTGIRTIIGVESFHGPVRDGKGWDRLAMVIRHDLLLCRVGLHNRGDTTNLEEVAERMPLVFDSGCVVSGTTLISTCVFCNALGQLHASPSGIGPV